MRPILYCTLYFAEPMAFITIEPAGKASLVYSYMQTRLMGQTADNCNISYWILIPFCLLDQDSQGDLESQEVPSVEKEKKTATSHTSVGKNSNISQSKPCHALQTMKSKILKDGPLAASFYRPNL